MSPKCDRMILDHRTCAFGFGLGILINKLQQSVSNRGVDNGNLRSIGDSEKYRPSPVGDISISVRQDAQYLRVTWRFSFESRTAAFHIDLIVNCFSTFSFEPVGDPGPLGGRNIFILY